MSDRLLSPRARLARRGWATGSVSLDLLKHSTNGQSRHEARVWLRRPQSLRESCDQATAVIRSIAADGPNRGRARQATAESMVA